MQTFSRKILALHSLIFFFTFSPSKQNSEESYCGGIKIQKPLIFSSNQNPNPNSSLISNIITCKSGKLYFRTSIGLFHVSSIDYTTKTLTISHSSCSSSQNFISPSLLSSGFPPPPRPNSVLLFNCSAKNQTSTTTIRARDCTRSRTCGYPTGSCLVVEDTGNREVGFHPNDLSCSNYRRVYRDSKGEEVKLGTRVSFDVPDQLPDICKECKTPDGNCGVGLRCLCHARECKNRVMNAGRKPEALGIVQFSLLVSMVLMVYFS